jgi:hypothetical protein
MTAVFHPVLSSDRRIVGGCSSGELNPSKLSVSLGPIPGPWLACYMIRRFGWPNRNSDDYKQLCTWMLTTPVKGLYLTVTPYLGEDGRRETPTNLHFGYTYDATIAKALSDDPGRKAVQKRARKYALAWWKKTGQHEYTFGTSIDQTDEVLIHKVGISKNDPEQFVGFWKRKPDHPQFRPPETRKDKEWWAGMLTMFLHWTLKDPGMPKMTEKEKAMPRCARQAEFEAALLASIRSLLHPTHVRDISFSCLGDIKRTPAAIKAYTNQEPVTYFDDAGWAPKILFSRRKKATA